MAFPQDALLNARSLTELDNRVEMLGVAAQENTGALIQFGRLQVEIEAAHQDLYDKKENLEGVRQEQEKYYATLSEQHAKLQTTIARIEAQLGENRFTPRATVGVFIHQQHQRSFRPR